MTEPQGMRVDIAIGVFDGVHRGHAHLIEQMVSEARAESHRSVCLTFDPDPEVVLYPDRAGRSLCSVQERVARLRSLGPDQVDVLPFTRDFARQSAEEFVDWLHGAYPLHALWCGSDFALGRDRVGTVEVLRGLARSRGFEVRAVHPLREDGRTISSSWVRDLLRGGDVRAAARLLGRPYTLEGPVLEGARRGRELGFPTANLAPPPGRALPADGVYAVRARVDGRELSGVANLGARPTFREGERLLETHLFDFSGNLYGKEIEVAFIERLRDVQRFASVDELRQQIDRDGLAARAVLERTSGEGAAAG